MKEWNMIRCCSFCMKRNKMRYRPNWYDIKLYDGWWFVFVWNIYGQNFCQREMRCENCRHLASCSRVCCWHGTATITTVDYDYDYGNGCHRNFSYWFSLVFLCVREFFVVHPARHRILYCMWTLYHITERCQTYSLLFMLVVRSLKQIRRKSGR